MAIASCAHGSQTGEQLDPQEDSGSPSTPDAAISSQPDAREPSPDLPAVRFGSDDRPWPQATFIGSEHSVIHESLGSVTEQLSAGLRYLHLPIHDNDFRERGDYGLGLDEPRDQLNTRGDNPTRENLGDWLELVVAWSDANPGHAPITLGIELRDDLTDNPNYEEGDLSRLNAILSQKLGEKLFASLEVNSGQWPTVDDLRGKVMVVLGGHEATRTMYREVTGEEPAITGDPNGQVVLVHETDNLDLRYWIGVRQGEVVSWNRSGVISEWITDPSIAINDEGLIVMVCSSTPAQDPRTIHMYVGELLPTGGLFWREPHLLDLGTEAFVRFKDPTTSDLEVLVDPGTASALRFEVTVRRNDGSVSIQKKEETEALAWDDATIESESAKRIHVYADEGGVLRYETEARRRPVSPVQLAFTEYAKGDHATLQRWFRFSDDLDEIKTWIAQGLIVRAHFSQDIMSLEQLPTILVTEEPFTDILAPFLEVPDEAEAPE